MQVTDSRTDAREWRRFIAAAILYAVLSVAFLIWIERRIGGDAITTAVDDIGEAVAAAMAAISCGLAARRTTARLRRAWSLLAASAAAWCAGEIAWTVYEVVFNVSVPFPSLADVGYLAAIPLTIAGILSFAHTARGTSTGLRLWLDRTIVAFSLLFVGWTLGLSEVFFGSGDTLFARMVGLAYPVGDILIATVLVLAIRRATDETHGRLFLLMAGVGANALADSAFAYLTASGSYPDIGSVLDAGWVVGYLLIALAALWPSGAVDRTAEEKPIDVWQLVVPWLAILAGGLSAVVAAMLGHPLDTFSTILAGLVIALIMVSQVLAHNESLSLLIRSRLATATLNEVIVHAPLGMVRISPDMMILQANPTFASILHAEDVEFTGLAVERFLGPSEMSRARDELGRLSADSVAATDFDTRARRDDGTDLWLHWTATAVRGRDSAIEYYLVMFEDVSARRAAAEVAVANLEVLERLNRVKSQFLTKVSHEFRTALVGIQGFSEYLKDAEQLDVDEVKEFATDIYDDARRLDRTLNEMLELDEAQSGSAALHMSEVDVSRLIEDVCADLQVGAPNHRIITELEPMPHVAADPEMLGHVVASLVTRALDYSPPDAPVRVSGGVFKDAVRVSVGDKGRASPGDLEAQMLGRTEPDVSAANARALASNIGLPMARQIVEMHGGRIWFDTSSGTVWTFTIPIAKRPEPASGPAAMESAVSG